MNNSLKEFEELGDIFANKQELTMSMNEIRTELMSTQQLLNKLDEKHTELEKQIVVREDLKDKATKEKAEEAISNIYSMLDEFNAQKKTSQELKEEFQILKEQIITTQNALVELNSSIQDLTRKY